jgi:hypothetical protein
VSGTIKLVGKDGAIYPYEPSGIATSMPRKGSFTSRIAFAAPHVVADPLRTEDPIAKPVIDWDTTLAYREHLWDLGFGIAEAMDTAQRGNGLNWPSALELIRRSCAASVGRLIFCGAGTDHLQAGRAYTLREITDAYLEQCAAVEAAGGRIILMASRALAATARSAEEYAQVYGAVLGQVRAPVILHWLGPMFDPALAGYWGTADVGQANESCLRVIESHAAKVDGIKISLLDAELEVSMRRRLPAGLRMYTGDDFNYDRLILGDGEQHSDALLGIFDAIAPVASMALSALDRGNTEEYDRLFEPTIPLSRHIFAAPTQYYKTGVVFLAFLNGFQRHFRMVGGFESARSIAHLCQLFVLADQAGVLMDRDSAFDRMRCFLANEGVA